jgi:hypothetical protein
MSLQPILTTMSDMFDECTSEISVFLANKRTSIVASSDFTIGDECLLEGVLSRAWQGWGNFCRSIVVTSCLGTTTSNGVAVPAHPDAHSEQHVSGAAKRAKDTATPPTWGKINALLRHEGTWGDTDLLATILPRMAVPRTSELLAAFSQANDSAKALQTIRNAAAHNNFQTLQEVNNLSSKYVAFRITHPIQALFWTVPSSGDYLLREALDDLKDNASIAIT